MGKIEPRSMRALRVQSTGEALASFLLKEDREALVRLAAMWECWSMVMGPELASLAIPLGHRRTTLIVGGEDAMAVQELAMQKSEILERVNIFMDGQFFTKVQVEQTMGRLGLDRPRPVVSLKMPPPPLPRPANLGRLVGVLDPQSAVGQCYMAYLAYFDRQDTRHGAVHAPEAFHKG
ncbi:DUF721 domain-containing protein [Desulfovibrio sp. OttesenSCG-928-I05]|nr:DUF721 domain-containing protein [Desulfovibrio sp. OttesenSCG-928-I05]